MTKVILAASFLIVWIGADVHCRAYNDNVSNEFQTRQQLKDGNWQVIYRKLKKELEKFSAKYTDRAKVIAVLPEPQRQEATMKFKQEFYLALKRMQEKLDRFGQDSKNTLGSRKGSFGDAFCKLHEFFEKIPRIIACILHACNTVPTPASTTEEDTTTEEMDSPEETRIKGREPPSPEGQH
ncbi:unnamed protein product [Hermetia illucens]|uniref:Uncharacterized protein n=1 Tax=Hermetia illucens TaxID=343691 RepID=A0A7R8V554_HERIL|nr:uncharacterized protein LOC119659836 isoform X2 [Hermetia illucens]CAD7092247.1 unnamed protein product [Hermetia illucens]